jgi:hypothetical protein
MDGDDFMSGGLTAPKKPDPREEQVEDQITEQDFTKSTKLSLEQQARNMLK